MFYIYILQSNSSQKFYVGYSADPWKRVIQHNEKDTTNYTGKGGPWILKAVFSVSEVKSDAIRLEKFIKRQKSRRLLNLLCDENFIPNNELAQLVRVPHLRD